MFEQRVTELTSGIFRQSICHDEASNAASNYNVVIRRKEFSIQVSAVETNTLSNDKKTSQECEALRELVGHLSGRQDLDSTSASVRVIETTERPQDCHW